MYLIKLFITVILLIASSQSQALFMPDGFKINTNTNTSISNDGC